MDKNTTSQKEDTAEHEGDLHIFGGAHDATVQEHGEHLQRTAEVSEQTRVIE